uniref:CSON007059 protein n=1 Tax=Culicoides sonorensis TaxID=179676 RepID=A0A336MWG0_CULSO
MPNSLANPVIADQHDWSPYDGENTTDDKMLLPIDMRFNDGHRLSIMVYSTLMLISAIGNLTVLTILIKRRMRGSSRIEIMLTHLAIADLMVTFLMMPLEIGWAVTVSWKGGDLMCRVMAFFRTFGLYLSSFILVCISIDRYYAVLRPLSLSENRGKIMVAVAWIFSCACSTPQVCINRFRRSSVEILSRAKRRTLRMSFTIVLVFVVCWTPFYVMSIWYWVDRETAIKLDQRIQKCLFLFACTNSCMNPIVYGVYNIRKKIDRNNMSSLYGQNSKKMIRDRDSSRTICISMNFSSCGDSVEIPLQK